MSADDEGPLPSAKVRAYLKSVDDGGPLDDVLDIDDVAGLLFERDMLFAQMSNAIQPVVDGFKSGTEKLHADLATARALLERARVALVTVVSPPRDRTVGDRVQAEESGRALAAEIAEALAHG